ncbi:MAG: hypothetical protein HEP71_25245 [Roseivirga sp.]|nr:hypothetical protein [Roseivirga sp.]
MSDHPKFRIYPPLGITRLGNGPAKKSEVIFSPEVPWENLYQTDNQYLTEKGEIKKQAQRFYIYECDKSGLPKKLVDPKDYDISWSVEVANKKPFWYVFNNCMDLSVQFKNQNLSPRFFTEDLAPGISAPYRNPNVLTKELRDPKIANYRKELVNHPGKVKVDAKHKRKHIEGQFPDPGKGLKSQLLKRLNASGADVRLGTLEYEKEGTLIFYPADGKSAALNPSDLNTDFADNANWYDDICDGRVTAVLTPKKGGKPIKLTDAKSAAWVASTPPDYAPQIQPISTMFDMVTGASKDEFTTDFSTVFPFMYRLYRMQWVNLGDFLAPSFKETIDELVRHNEFKYLYTNDGSKKAQKVRDKVFKLFRNPEYPLKNEPIIPSKDMTQIKNAFDETADLQFPFYPGDAIDYPGSPAQWFAIPPLLYKQFKHWRDGDFKGLKGDFCSMEELGKHYQHKFRKALDEKKHLKPLMMSRAILETLYGGGFHPGVELTWPMRHAQMYAENKLIGEDKTGLAGLYGLREIRLNAASEERQKEIFYNDFGLRMNPQDVQDSLDPKHKKHWLWEATPGDLTKWMGIPWQSDAGSCQAVFVESQYPTPAWWAANLPVSVLPEDGYEKMKDNSITAETRRSIFASRLPWLHTADTGFVGYHAEGGYTNGLIAMVYQWKNVGMVTGRKMKSGLDGVPKVVYVSENGPQKAKKKKK